MVSEAVPVLVRVVVCGPDVLPTILLPNDRLVGLRPTAGIGAATPVPDSGALFGLVEAFVVKARAAVLAPSADGVNVMLTTQLLPADRFAPHVFDENA